MKDFYAWILVLQVACIFPQIGGEYFDVCNPGSSTEVFAFTTEKCPEGVLFELPIITNCLKTPGGPENFVSDLCEENLTLSEHDRPYKVQFWKAEKSEAAADSQAGVTCHEAGDDRCPNATLTTADSTTLTEPERADLCDVDHPDANISQEEQARRNDSRVFNQTERMFKIIVGLITDSKPNGPSFRVIKLLKQSFRILGIFCDHINYVPSKFTQDVLTAFLYLMRDSDLSNFKDVSVEDYNIIKGTLDTCEQMNRDPFKLRGTNCKSCSLVHFIEKEGQSRRYAENEFSFSWGRYDLPVDATWGVLSFVHGLCYGTFRLNINYHHLFQRVTEILFTPEIQYRWNRPPQLHFEDIWDNMFSTPVKSTMRNLDVCIAAAYQNTPFLHRLERLPMEMSAAATTLTTPVPGKGTTRRRRSVGSSPTMSLDNEGLEGAGWCFSTREDAVATLNAYVDIHCPTSKKYLESITEKFYPKPQTLIDINGTEAFNNTVLPEGGEGPEGDI